MSIYMEYEERIQAIIDELQEMKEVYREAAVRERSIARQLAKIHEEEQKCKADILNQFSESEQEFLSTEYHDTKADAFKRTADLLSSVIRTVEESDKLSEDQLSDIKGTIAELPEI